MFVCRITLYYYLLPSMRLQFCPNKSRHRAV